MHQNIPWGWSSIWSSFWDQFNHKWKPEKNISTNSFYQLKLLNALLFLLTLPLNIFLPKHQIPHHHPYKVRSIDYIIRNIQRKSYLTKNLHQIPNFEIFANISHCLPRNKTNVDIFCSVILY